MANSHSLWDNVMAEVGAFLYSEAFAKSDILQRGIVEAINLISDYHEEGRPLYPELIITNSRDFFKTIPNKELIVGKGPVDISEFRTAIKLCAPLAMESWTIFIEVLEKEIVYGLVSAEMTETSLSLFNQLVGPLKVDYGSATMAYIRNIKSKTVELSGIKTRIVVSLSLSPPVESSVNHLSTLSRQVCLGCDDGIKQMLTTYLEKQITNALRIGHGNLIAVIKDDVSYIERLRESETKGTYLPEPIDFQQLFSESENQKDNESSFNLRSYASILKTMINHDGITVFTNNGRLIGYHLMINRHEKAGDTIVGGTRSTAFVSMINCNLFDCCFFKSQDGETKIWVRS